MAGRRKEYRTWDEFSASERRRGLTILGGAGLVAVVAVVGVYGGTGGGGTPVGAPPPAMSAAAVVESPAGTDPDLDEWYAAIDGYRKDIGLAEADVRKAIAEANGMALQPACALLETHAAAAGSAGVATPAGDAGQAWTDGLSAFKQATRSCAQLFDGTQVPPTTLLNDTSTSLDAADSAWTGLASPSTQVAVAAGSEDPSAPTASAAAG
ncbi:MULTISPECIES: hypothetical protein [unclassified Pseudofrankia]|uniref:hypothetical protein n=1 Tax=unclassified Pseudofrankia TaxID=2994372 RepID=UPI0008DAB0F1|nr:MULTISPECIES: hypothetical protein [unclassified Pseudofrankia]MDT3441267.1 hypothetical protein [Pseudofrankia sp. BMG5.37]OHV48247.1 hypothetical protein BCD48_16175 [Pseudofrankia sp. BMG5.36]